jgi:hypothetical protein
MNTPIAFFIFKRPDTTEQVFDVIRQAKPSKLFVIADGPRSDRPGEAEKCAATRAIIDRVDWKCEVIKNYSETNLGCGKRVSSGLNWVFEQAQEAIILEDDCVPHPTFFRFCQELLEQYQLDHRVMSISARNVPQQHRLSKDSYHFSRYQRCWGWATWKRAWQHFDFEMKLWPFIRDHHLLEDILGDSKQAKQWMRTFQSVYDGRIDTWDYQWMFACWLQSGLSILPSVNLVENIGFGPEATHTQDSNSYLNNLLLEEINFPLCHPKTLIRDSKADDYIQKTIHSHSKISYIKNKFMNYLHITGKS